MARVLIPAECGLRLPVADNLFTLVTTEFVVGKVIGVVGAGVAILISKLRKKPHVKKEFQVAQSTINLLYFQMLAFMPALFMPFAPVLCLGLMLLNFKWDAFYLKKFLAKPKKPWAAKDAGVFYVKFYFFVVINVLFCNIVVLSERTMPKECSIQGTWVPEATTAYLRASGTDPEEFAKGVCEDSCGPFAGSESANAPVVEAIDKLPVLGTLQKLSTETSTFPWFVAFLLWVRVNFRNNSLAVQRDLSAEKDMSWKAALDSLSRKVKKQARQLQLAKGDTAAGGSKKKKE